MARDMENSLKFNGSLVCLEDSKNDIFLKEGFNFIIAKNIK